MTIIRSIGYLVGGLLSPLLIPLFIVAYVILYCVLGMYNTWLRASRNPKYDPYWWVE